PLSLVHIHLYSASLHTFLFSFNDPAPTDIYTLSLHDALPICHPIRRRGSVRSKRQRLSRLYEDRICHEWQHAEEHRGQGRRGGRDRKSTRLNSSHVAISYAVFCLKKKKKNTYK